MRKLIASTFVSLTASCRRPAEPQDPDHHLWEIVWNPQLLPEE